MKFFLAMSVYSVIALLLVWGILRAVSGNPGLLITVSLGYLAALGLMGCLPKKSHG